MVTVALIGADGAGKSTLAEALERDPPVRLKTIYMGLNSAAARHMLPTTRLFVALKRARGKGGDEGGPPDPARAARRPKSGPRRWLSEAKSALWLANQTLEEWYRTRLARRYEARGYLVLFDRHFYADYWAHDVRAGGTRSLARRWHGKWIARLRRPDHTVLLDAPAEVLFARKGEGTLELVAARRAEYLALRAELANCTVIDASRPPAEVQAEVRGLLQRLAAAEGGA